MLQNTSSKTHTYALKSMLIIELRILENQFNGLLLKLNEMKFGQAYREF